MLYWRHLPLHLAATLASGLPDDSRSKRGLTGQTSSLSLQMQAAATDSLLRLEWRLAGCPGGRPPQAILAALTGTAEDTGGVQGFDSPEEFEAACAALKGG